MHNAAREGDPCPMCGTKLRSMQCGACHGTGTSELFIKRDCKNCGGTGKPMGCPNFFSHPGVGPQGPVLPPQARPDNSPIIKRLDYAGRLH
jgi:hypothetical protein